jgi:hypothetical protein
LGEQAVAVQDPDDISEACAGPALGEQGDLLQGISSEQDLICVASGRVVKKDAGGKMAERTRRCRRCRHHMLVDELGASKPGGAAEALQHCPLCHAHLPPLEKGA